MSHLVWDALVLGFLFGFVAGNMTEKIVRHLHARAIWWARNHYPKDKP